MYQILHGISGKYMCSCFIEFIKRDGEKDKMQGLPAQHFIFISQRV